MAGSSILRAPLVHFLALGLLGSALLGRCGETTSGTTPSPPRIVLDGERIDELRRDFRGQTGRAPTPSELERLVSQAVDEELLYREALARGLAEDDSGIATRLVQKMEFLDEHAIDEDPDRLLARARSLGLDREDIVVRRILIQKLRLLATELAPEEQPDETEVARVFELRRDSLRTPERRDLVHVFLSHDRRRERTRADAARLRRRIERERLDPAAAARLGDAFPFGHDLDQQAPDDLARTFGDAFAASSFALESGLWSQPIASAYGLHLVRIDGIEPGEIPELDRVRERLRRELVEEARDRRLEALLAELRTRYEVAFVEAGEERK